jgi:toxin-antitoxin system PIN domain toxin
MTAQAAVSSEGPGKAVHLLDGNVLVALVSPSHVHHAQAEHWFAEVDAPFATCPVTQGTLLRILMNIGQMEASAARGILGQLTAHPRHRFWPDALGYEQISWRGVIGHRQITDAYLAGLARHFNGRLVTLDRGLGAVHPDITVVLPSS